MFETKRLKIRKLTINDIEPWMEFLMGENSLDYFPGMEPTLETSKAWIERQIQRYSETGNGLMALELKNSGELVGQCGFINQEIDGNHELEIGYHIIPCFRGQGYATEAAIAFKEYALKNKIADSLVSCIHTENLKSIKVAERNGMTLDYTTTDLKMMPGVPHFVYRIRG